MTPKGRDERRKRAFASHWDDPDASPGKWPDPVAEHVGTGASVQREEQGLIRITTREVLPIVHRVKPPINNGTYVLSIFAGNKKSRLGEAAKPKDDEVEQSADRSGAGVRQHVLFIWANLNGLPGGY